MTRNPSEDPTPLDLASFYVESLKYGAGPGKLQAASVDEFTNELEILLRDAGVTTMTGEELRDALEYYVHTLSLTLGLHAVLVRSILADGLMHGIALAGGLRGEHRNPRKAATR